MAAAVQLLMREAAALRGCALGKAASGVVRLEVPIPATFTSLQWLMTQPANTQPTGGAQPGGGAQPPARALAPAVASAYFSARSAPAPASNPVDATASSTCAGAPCPVKVITAVYQRRVVSPAEQKPSLDGNVVLRMPDRINGQQFCCSSPEVPFRWVCLKLTLFPDGACLHVRYANRRGAEPPTCWWALCALLSCRARVAAWTRPCLPCTVTTSAVVRRHQEGRCSA